MIDRASFTFHRVHVTIGVWFDGDDACGRLHGLIGRQYVLATLGLLSSRLVAFGLPQKDRNGVQLEI